MAVLVLLEESTEAVLFTVSAFMFLISDGEAGFGLDEATLLGAGAVHVALSTDAKAGEVVTDGDNIAGGGLVVRVWCGVDGEGGNGAFKAVDGFDVLTGGGLIGSEGVEYFITVSNEVA
jgi:hypothetical protein